MREATTCTLPGVLRQNRGPFAAKARASPGDASQCWQRLVASAAKGQGAIAAKGQGAISAKGQGAIAAKGSTTPGQVGLLPLLTLQQVVAEWGWAHKAMGPGSL